LGEDISKLRAFNGEKSRRATLTGVESPKLVSTRGGEKSTLRGEAATVKTGDLCIDSDGLRSLSEIIATESSWPASGEKFETMSTANTPDWSNPGDSNGEIEATGTETSERCCFGLLTLLDDVANEKTCGSAIARAVWQRGLNE
jgi:hypothetical protein